MDAQRALLDDLMGTARNLTDEEKKGHREMKWDDREVCKSFMVRFCPHDLFVNTKSNIGPCPKIHDLKLKESFENSPRHDSYVPRFEAELAQHCERLVVELDRKVKRGRERLAEPDLVVVPPLSREKSEQLVMVEEKIKKLLEQVEALGEAGKVDEAEALMRMVDALIAEKKAITQPSDKSILPLQDKKMELCEICGSFLVANDAAERTNSHITGKQHIGYGMVREFLAEHKASREKAKEEERLAREKQAEERKRQREENEASVRERSRERDRQSDEYRGRSRERERFQNWRGGGGRDGRRASNYRHGHYGNARGSDDRYRNEDVRQDQRRAYRSRSPGTRGYRRSSRSPDRQY